MVDIGRIVFALVTLAWSGRRSRVLLLPRRGTAGPWFRVAGCTLSPRRFLLGSRTNGRPADLVTSALIMMALGVSRTFRLRGRPGDVCINLVVLALTGLVFGRLRSFRLGERPIGLVRFRSRGRNR